MSFTELFNKTPIAEKPVVADEERNRRVEGTPDQYVAVPVVVPKMSSMVENAVAGYDLFWLVGLPGPFEHPKVPGKKAREAINVQCPREEVCEDLCFVLNAAAQARKEAEAATAIANEAQEPGIEGGGAPPDDGSLPDLESVLTGAKE